MSLFTLDLADGYDLVLADATTVDDLFAVTVANIDRLRRWEPWAQADPDLDQAREYVRASLHSYADGTMLPCVIRAAGRPVGSIALRMKPDTGAGELGYWIAAEHEGRGAVFRAAEALIGYAFTVLRLHRIEIRTAVHNDRSRALAERLGFVEAGVLPSAHRVGAVRHDLVVYRRLEPDAR